MSVCESSRGSIGTSRGIVNMFIYVLHENLVKKFRLIPNLHAVLWKSIDIKCCNMLFDVSKYNINFGINRNVLICIYLLSLKLHIITIRHCSFAGVDRNEVWNKKK